LFGIEQGTIFHASAQETPIVQGFVTQAFLTDTDTTDVDILSALFPASADMKSNVYTELWEAKNYGCDSNKMSVARLKV